MGCCFLIVGFFFTGATEVGFGVRFVLTVWALINRLTFEALAVALCFRPPDWINSLSPLGHSTEKRSGVWLVIAAVVLVKEVADMSCLRLRLIVIVWSRAARESGLWYLRWAAVKAETLRDC